MRRKPLLRISIGILVSLAVPLVLLGSSWAATYKTLYKFTASDGSQPDYALTFDATGNLYGSACLGGAYGYGVVFELTPGPDGVWTETVLHEFSGGADGGCPLGGLIFDAAGNLYGVTLCYTYYNSVEQLMAPSLS